MGRFCQKLDLERVEITGKPPNITVTARHLAPLQADIICNVSWPLTKKSPKAKGLYDGWEPFDTSTALTETPETEEDLMTLLASLARSEA